MRLVEIEEGADRRAGTDADALAITTIRMLAADAVQAAGSGHPGLPMGAAAPAWVLWSRFLRHDPADPEWPDRDRFVLSAGHGSMLLYALLHLFGYDLPRDELRRFRQWGSRTPGHPEHRCPPGVETTTGPLGQGLGNAVGMALAERMLAARANTAEHPVVGHRTWVLAGDGDLMEGVSHEAGSLAGHLGLGRLIVIYDDNDVTIDGPAHQSCTDDVLGRFAAYGWHVQRVADGEDLDALTTAFDAAVAAEDKPSLIAVRTTIGHGAPTVAGTPEAHGAPLGAAELAATRAAFDWPDEPFHVPAEVREHCARLAASGAAARAGWLGVRAAWERAHPELAAVWGGAAAPPADLEKLLPIFEPGSATATRAASGAVLAALAPEFAGLVGGSADLAGSTCTTLPGTKAVTRDDQSGRTVHFGIREHAMGAALNGMALHGGFRPFGSTFLVFSDYLRPAVRLAALMRLPVVYVFTHDSIAVGEDGPTHQPVEHLESLRLIPGLAVLRPGDANETAECWRVALRHDGPVALVLSRQSLPVLEPVRGNAIAAHGARIVRDDGREPDLTLVATGSEVALALDSAAALAVEGRAVRVLSVPWRERFAEALAAGAELLPPCPTVWLEAGVPHGWEALARPGDTVLGLRRFGASAPGRVVCQALGYSVPAVVRAALECLGKETACRTN